MFLRVRGDFVPFTAAMPYKVFLMKGESVIQPSDQDRLLLTHSARSVLVCATPKTERPGYTCASPFQGRPLPASIAEPAAGNYKSTKDSDIRLNLS